MDTKEVNMTLVGWVPLLGEFNVVEGEVRFHGKRIPLIEPPGGLETGRKDQPAVGILLSSWALADGKVSAEVEFDQVTVDSMCEVAIAYDSNGGHFVTAGLGSDSWAMFGIREYGGPRSGWQGWWNYRVAGDRVNLKPGRVHLVEVDLRGAFLTLHVDGVAVGTAEVTSPMGRARQVGVICKGEHLITVRNLTVEATPPKAFVVMQFGGGYNDLYDDVVKEVCKSYKVNVLRADEVSGPGLIISDIVREIHASQLIIADITPNNSNVFFEVGYALALGKPTILLAQKDTDLPFDVAGFRVLFYEDTIGGKKKLEDGMRRHLDAILAE